MNGTSRGPGLERQRPEASGDARGAWLGLSRSAARADRAGALVDERRELLVVSAAGSHYAIAIERIREIVRLPAITRIPRTPDWMVGVVALRGEIVQVVDLCRRLGLSSRPPSRASRIVSIHGADEGIAGILVDSVDGVMRVPEQEILPAPASDMRAVVGMIRAEQGFVALLELDRIVGAGDD